ncbi:MAG: DUF4422 domain-containing protein [Butyricicoccaceae bacterium]
MNAILIIAAHKEYRMPSARCYLPLHVGRACSNQKLNYLGDDTGDNISAKNPSFCELTGLYWAWKNLDCDYLGLVHYRRYFTNKSRRFRRRHSPWDCILSDRELQELIAKHDVIVPTRQNYVIETLYSHYAHTHYAEHLDLTREIIREQCPEFLPDFDAVMRQTGGYMFNMFVMKRRLCDRYCTWLFPILFELEQRVDVSGLSAFQARLFGRISELLFNVWLRHARIRPKELDVVYMEPVNWFKKGSAFLQAKFRHKKFEGSF